MFPSHHDVLSQGTGMAALDKKTKISNYPHGPEVCSYGEVNRSNNCKYSWSCTQCSFWNLLDTSCNSCVLLPVQIDVALGIMKFEPNHSFTNASISCCSPSRDQIHCFDLRHLPLNLLLHVPFGSWSFWRLGFSASLYNLNSKKNNANYVVELCCLEQVDATWHYNMVNSCCVGQQDVYYHFWAIEITITLYISHLSSLSNMVIKYLHHFTSQSSLEIPDVTSVKIICRQTFLKPSLSGCIRLCGCHSAGKVVKLYKVCQRDTAESKARGTVCIKVNLNWLD